VRTPILLLVATLTTACGAGALPQSQPHPFLEKEPPAMEQMGLDGSMISFPQKGEVTVVDFWATSCKPCVKMMPAIEDLYQARKGTGVAVIGVAIDDNPGLVEKRLKELGVTYPNMLDDSASSLRGTYQVDELPQTFIFDKQGHLRVVTKGGEETDVGIIQDAVDVLSAE
jgi:thiol-disulfide isomerase/thioredoxin